MLESFIITLREGVEAALVVCLALAYLRKIDRPDLRRTVWGGVGVASFLSIAAGILVYVFHIRTDGRIEGILLLVSSALVAWLVFWMWRHGKRLKARTETRLGNLAAGSKFGVFLFSFLMVFREGMEMVFMLVSAGLTSETMMAGAGAAGGLVLAVALGVAFTRGTLRVDLGKFFSVTSVILLLFAVQLLVSGIHEFAEQGDLPSGATYMRIVGPLMKHSAFFVIAVLILPFLLMLRRAVAGPAAPSANPAEERKELARSRGERIAKGAFAMIGILTIVTLGVAWAQESRAMVLSDPEIVFEPTPELLVPVEKLADGRLHRFAVPVEGKLLRFLIMKKDPKKDEYAGAMDACTICMDKGYAQIGESLRCLNCAAEIQGSTFGESGGCNPIPLVLDPRRPAGEQSVLERRGDRLVVPLDRLAVHASFFRTAGVSERTCASCGMKIPAGAEGGERDGKPYCRMPACLEKLKGK